MSEAKQLDDCCASEPLTNSFDVAVIGAGSAGFSAAITAAEAGARVVLIGHGTIGGTCVNVGCVPSKAMIRAAEAIHHARSASRFDGIEGAAELYDWQALITQKQALVDSLREAKYEDLLGAYDQVAYIEGKAHLEKNGVRVDDRLITADKIIVATGASSALPDIDGIADVPYLTSTTALELEAPPQSLIVIGGGYIGCELAQMFSRIGTDVTIVTRSHLLSDGEPEISTALSQYFEQEGITVLDSLAYEHIATGSAGLELSIRRDGKNEIIEAEHLLVATGRKPNVEGLGLEALGVTFNKLGGIEVDRQMRTTRPDIYAAGDVTGQDQFVYMAAYGAKLAAKNAFVDDSLAYDNHAMPAVVFTDPQIATVGQTEKQAVAEGITVKTSVLDLSHVPRALAARDTRGLIKLVADADSGRLLGAHILAPDGADSIQTAAIAIAQGMTYSALADMIFPYLTTVEGLKLASQTFDKDVTKLSCCAG